MRARNVLLCLALAAISLSVVGCGQVKVSEAASYSTPGPEAAGARPQHDLAVLAAEIDPPLDGAISFPSGTANFQLLVAVENRGSQPERDVIVEAWLRGPQAGESAVLLSGRTITPYLAPGQVEVATLTASGVIPLYDTYGLVVSVRPAPGETYVGNNTSEYQISVTLPRS